MGDYTISKSGTQTIVADGVAGRDGTDYLMNVEFMKFSDGTLATADIGKPSAMATTGQQASPATGDNFNFSFVGSGGEAAHAVTAPSEQPASPATPEATAIAELAAHPTSPPTSEFHAVNSDAAEIAKAPAHHDVLMV